MTSRSTSRTCGPRKSWRRIWWIISGSMSRRSTGADKLYQGGLKVYTTIDMDLQRTAVTALKDGLRALDKRQGFRGRVGFKAAQVHADPDGARST